MQQREEVSMETAWLSSLGRIAQRMKRIAAAGLVSCHRSSRTN